MCLAGIVAASQSLTQEVASSNPFTVMTNILVNEFNENIQGKMNCPSKFNAGVRKQNMKACYGYEESKAGVEKVLQTHCQNKTVLVYFKTDTKASVEKNQPNGSFFLLFSEGSVVSFLLHFEQKIILSGADAYNKLQCLYFASFFLPRTTFSPFPLM